MHSVRKKYAPWELYEISAGNGADVYMRGKGYAGKGNGTDVRFDAASVL